MITDRFRWVDWSLWLQWVAATAGGAALGFAAGRAAARHPAFQALPGHWALAPLLVGLFVGLAQWLVLRRRLDGVGWWIPATLAASPVIWFGPWVGLLQWLVLRRKLARSGWWIVGCAATWTPAAAAAEVLSRLLGDRFVILGGFMGLAAGVGTGFTLAWLIPRPVEEVEERAAPAWLAPLKELARLTAVGTLSGLVPGLLAGVGSRLAMHMAGVLAGPEAQARRVWRAWWDSSPSAAAPSWS